MHSTPISFHLSRTTYVFLGIVAGVFIGTTIKFALGWNPPPAGGPPDPNAAAPINVSATPQYKAGPLGINKSVTPDSGFGAAIGDNLAVGGKIYSASTVDSDSGSTVVTKDYLEGKLGGVESTSVIFGGMYYYGPYSCATPNPVTNACSCPSGYTKVVFQYIGGAGSIDWCYK